MCKYRAHSTEPRTAFYAGSSHALLQGYRGACARKETACTDLLDAESKVYFGCTQACQLTSLSLQCQRHLIQVGGVEWHGVGPWKRCDV